MRVKAFFRLLPAIALLLGCAAQPVTPAYENPGPGWTRNDMDETVLFLITDDSMAKQIDIVNPTGFNNKEKALKVTCRLGNLTLQPLPIQIRALFKDRNGATINSSAWQNAALPPAPAYVPFEASDESGQAVKVMIELRRKG